MKTLLKNNLTRNLRWLKIVIVALFILLSYTGHSQSWQWVKRGGSTQNPSNSNPNSELVQFLETDSNGNIYVVSPVTQYSLDIDGNAKTGYGYKDNVLASFSCDGTYRWSTVIGGPEDNDYFGDIKVDSNGDVYVLLQISWGDDEFQELFHFDSSTTIPLSFVNRKRICIAKYSGLTGNVIWYKFPQADGLSGLDYLYSNISKLIIDTDGSLIILARLIQGVYFNGQFNNTATGTNNFIIKCNAIGDFISAVQINTEMAFGNIDLGHPFQFLKHPINGKYYIYAYFSSFNGAATTTDEQTTKIVCIAPTGIVEWTKSITNNIGSGNNLLETFEIDASGNLYVGGATRVGNAFGTYTITAPPIPFNEYEKGFLVKLDTNGNVIWGTNSTVTPANGSQCNVLHVKGNEVVVSPKWHGITWGGSYPATGGSKDASLYIFDKTTGAFINNTRMSSIGGSESMSVIKTDVFNNYVVGGYFDFNISAGTNNVYNNGGGSDFFVAKYGLNNGNCALSTVTQNEVEKVMVYPNPATTELFVNTQEKISYTIYNILGTKVANGEVENTTTPIAISHLANGNYIIQIKNTAGEVKKVKFMKI